MSQIPKEGFLRLNQIIGKPGTSITPIIPVCRTAWYAGIKKGIYPAGHKLSPGTTVWKAEDIRKLIESKSA